MGSGPRTSLAARVSSYGVTDPSTSGLSRAASCGAPDPSRSLTLPVAHGEAAPSTAPLYPILVACTPHFPCTRFVIFSSYTYDGAFVKGVMEGRGVVTVTTPSTSLRESLVVAKARGTFGAWGVEMLLMTAMGI